MILFPSNWQKLESWMMTGHGTAVGNTGASCDASGSVDGEQPPSLGQSSNTWSNVLTQDPGITFLGMPPRNSHTGL